MKDISPRSEKLSKADQILLDLIKLFKKEYDDYVSNYVPELKDSVEYRQIRTHLLSLNRVVCLRSHGLKYHEWSKMGSVDDTEFNRLTAMKTFQRYEWYMCYPPITPYEFHEYARRIVVEMSNECKESAVPLVKYREKYDSLPLEKLAPRKQELRSPRDFPSSEDVLVYVKKLNPDTIYKQDFSPEQRYESNA